MTLGEEVGCLRDRSVEMNVGRSVESVQGAIQAVVSDGVDGRWWDGAEKGFGLTWEGLVVVRYRDDTVKQS